MIQHKMMNKNKQIDSRFALNKYLEKQRQVIDAALIRLLGCGEPATRLCLAMHYSLMASGKRLRPILCLAAAEAVGCDRQDDILQVACAIEMIHTYSLIHDDLPAMDDDQLRRGKPTCHVEFDEATAILAGDALLTLAFELLASPGNLTSHAHAEKRFRVLQIIAKAAGYRGMIEGQMRDIAAEGKQLALEDLKSLHALKTGALIEAAVISGAISGGGTDDEIGHLSRYAQHIGLAFQVTDDILNIEGSPEIMGKASGTDALREKSTYPALMGKKSSREYAETLIRNAIEALSFLNHETAPLAAIAQYVVERDR